MLVFLFVCLPVTGKIMMRCYLECSMTTRKADKTFNKRSHWHCCLCPQLFRRIKEFQMHLARHQKISKPPIKKAPKDSAIPEKGMPENPLPFKELKAQEHKNTC